jgi:hypothetical protein
MRWVLFTWMVALSAVQAADLNDPQRLTRIRTQMARTLAHLPDYTCRETIERALRRPPSNRYENRDALRVDVAYLNGRELYAWPGDRLGERTLFDMVPDGSIATGNFGMLGRAVFADNGPIFHFEGTSAANGKNQVKYSFQVPLANSTYTVRYGVLAATVAYHGWFTADADTYDVIAFEIEANEIPRNLDTLQATEYTEYARVQIGNSDYLIPTASETMLMDLKGEIARNQIIFARCREYAGESTVTFTEPGADLPTASSPAAPQPLPARIELHVRLTTPIARGVTAIGDRVSAEVTRAVRGPVSIPTGSAVTLRVIGMETGALRAGSVSVIKLRLLRVDAAGQPYDARSATLRGVAGLGRYYGTPEGWVSVSGSLRIPAGLQMTWVTEP